MGRVISNTFSLTAVPDVQATRPNLVHCSQFTKDRLGWWILPDRSNAYSYGVESGMYGIDGYNAYGVLAQPGMIADIRQYLAKEYRASQADYNKETSNYALDAGKWYTLSFKVRGIAKKRNSDGSFSDGGDTRLYVYLVGYNGGGVSIVDTSEKYIVDGVEKYPSGDMNTSFVLNWTVSTHTITFKTRSDLKTISNHAVPVLYFRSFGEGHTTYPTYFANGGCLFRIAAIKIEEGMEATAYTPHATEMQPPVHAVAFKRDNTNISGTTPTGGTYTSPTPTGWSDGIPSGEARLWETKAVFVPELSTATLSAVTWSKPSPVGDTSDSDVEFSPYDGTPTSEVSNNLAAAGTAATSTTNKWFDPVRNAGADFTKMIWRAERQKKNGVWDEKWAIVKVKGEKGEAGKDAITLDLDNQMDSISVDSDGNVKLPQTVTTHPTIFKGATTVRLTKDSVTATSINGIEAEITDSDGIVTISYTFQPTSDGFDDRHYTSEISVTYGGVTYKATFTLAPVRDGANGKNAVIYNVHPSLTSCPFSRTSTNGYSPTTYNLTCGYVCNNGGISTTVANATGSFNGGWHIFYRINNSGTWGDWNLYEKAVPVTYYHRSVEFCIAKTSDVQELIDDPYDSLIVDRETVPVVVGGSNGASAFTVDLDNEMDAIPCDSSGYLSSARTFNLNIGAYYGTKPVDLDSVSCNVNRTNSGISINTNTPNSPVITFAAGTYSGTYEFTFTCTHSTYGTRKVVFTIAVQKAGSPGASPAIYNLVPSHTSLSFSRDANGNLTGSFSVTCQVSRTVGSSTSMITPSNYGLTIKYGWNNASSCSTEYSGAITAGTGHASYANLIFELYSGSTRIDRETIPILKDGSKGEEGPSGSHGMSLDFFASANTIMMGETRIESSSINFKATMAYGDNEPSAIYSSEYRIVVREYDSNGNNTETNNYKETENYSCDYTHNISNTTTLTKLVAELQKNGTVIRTLTIPVVKKGADGRSYNPVLRGIWTSGETYKWDDKQRDYVDYEISGVYYRFGVKTYDTSVTAEPSLAGDDANWEVCNRVSCLITNCIFGTNAVIGGFIATAGKFMSTENAYALRYMRQYEKTNKVNYRGSYSGGISYSQNDAVYHNGTYYYSKISGNTATPSGSSNWASCSSLLIERIKEAGVGTVYLYEYDNATLKRPVVQLDGGTYYTIKKMGAATTKPTDSNSNWRELTDNELSFLSVGTGSETTSILSYVPKYTLNGNNGTVIMIQADDTCWTYDDTGKQVNGIPYGKRVEIVPASKSIDVYDETGELALQVNGDTYNNVDKAYGSGTITPSCVTNGVEGQLSSDSSGSVKTMQSLLSSDSVGYFEVKDYPLNLSVTCAFSLIATELRTTATPSGNYGPILSVPRFEGNQWVYRNDCQGAIVVQKQNSDGVTWGNHNQLVSVSTAAKSGTVSRYSDTLSCILQPGKYRLVFVFTASLFGTSNHGYSYKYSYCSFNVTHIEASGNYEVKTSRVFANGLAFGSATNDNFVVVRESGGIHVKAATKISGHGFELSQSKGFEVKRNGYQGASLPVLFVARATYLSENAKKEYEYLYWNEALRKPTMTWTARGVCEIVLGSDYPTSEHIMPTLTSYAAPEMGVSARIKSWSGQKIIIELDSDYNSPNDYGGFYIKLEYIG